MPDASKLSTIPVGQLGILPLESSYSLGQKVDRYLVKWRKERLIKEPKESIIFDGYEQDSREPFEIPEIRTYIQKIC